MISLVGCGPKECEHEWEEATYLTPKTCKKCGETEGEKLKNYFEEHELSVEPTLPEKVAFTYTTFSTNNHKNATVHEDGKMVFTQKVEDAKKEGYKLITFTLTANMPIVLDKVTENEFSAVFGFGFYDYYTGEKYPSKGTIGDESEAYKVDFTYNQTTFDIDYTYQTEWSNSDWYNDSNGTRRIDVKAINTYTFTVPENYDGLVFAQIPKYKYADIDDEKDERGIYAMDLDADELANTTFIRLGK